MNSLMWAPTTRARHNRDALRFATDVAEREFAVLEPLFPALAGIDRARCARSFRRFSMSCVPVALGGCRRTVSHLVRRCTDGSPHDATMASGRRPTIIWSCWIVNVSGGIPPVRCGHG
jgi:hypothetical protein